ncbi:hypothetical protein [Paraburkholderia solisilvae]|uniref:Uncharacterized protein n=1 Tax=Paraburkholderia solisilvae TaxID=624376 RepID=A0A6J5F0Z4_9BURK|nr:hypothetical protein [Paraburkholderia solisilvae]CAB3772024.1 hypothetical protein LMG29739_06177 [Paraburkholderia solisilvae]
MVSMVGMGSLATGQAWIESNRQDAGARDVPVRVKRAQFKPRWQSNKESWAEFQCRYYNWRMGLPARTSCVGSKIPPREGRTPDARPADIALQVALSFVSGGPFNPVIGGRFAGAGSVAVLSRPGGGLRFDLTIVGERPVGARPATAAAAERTGAPTQSPMDTTSPPRSNAQSPMDTASQPRSNAQSPMDTASPPRSNAQSPMDTASPPRSNAQSPMDTVSPPHSNAQTPMDIPPPSSDALSGKPTSASTRAHDFPAPKPAAATAGANIEVHTPASQGLYLNRQGMLEKKAFSTVYRVAPVSERDAIQQYGFLPSTHFGGIDKMISGDALIVSETADGARVFGDGEYGPGCYDLYEIDARGYIGASLQDNVDFNTRVMASRLGYTREALESMPPRDIAEGALEFREAHIDAAAGGPHRLRLIEYGALPPPASLNDVLHGGKTGSGSASDR